MSAMRRLWQYLVEPGDESLVRVWSGIVLGVCSTGLPVVFGVLDLRTCLIASLTGAIPATLFWRQVDRRPNGLLAIVAFVTTFLLFVGILRNFGGVAGFVYWGGFAIVLSLIRLATGYRDPFGPPPEPEWSPDPASRPLVWLALVLPLLVLVGVIVIGIAVERGAFR
jgi:hypothetical protein